MIWFAYVWQSLFLYRPSPSFILPPLGLGLSDRQIGMVVVNSQIKLPRKFQVDPKTQTHFLSDLFFLIAIRPVVGLWHP